MSLLASASVFLAYGSVIAAPTPTPARAEIESLLSRLQFSGCEFNRNGSWYSGAEAKDHLHRKLEYFDGKNTALTAEQFIELAATKSSSSGKPYQVKCGTEPAVESQQWLRQQLTSIRVSGSKSKP